MNNIAIILNNRAKNAKLIDNYLAAFNKEKIDYHCYQVAPENLETQIKNCLTDYSLLLVGGGDGTIRSAAQWCANSSTTLGVLPLGTMNHFAKELHLPLTEDDLVAALKQPKFIKIDLAEVNGKVFVNNSSIGFYPKLARKRDFYAKHYPKWLSYIPSFLEALRYHEKFSITIKNEEENFSINTSFLMVSNNLYSYQFPVTIGRDSFNQKVLGIYFLKRGKLSLIKVIDHLFRKSNNFEIRASKTPINVDIKKKARINISLDGDTTIMDTPLIYRCLPNSLKLLTLK
ncbi:diacylglycerol/lipid kinase family protein [Legionella jamestowniensis]|uniref:Diacylglycerol kinase n=1 Tax=Legionella jamestowniensis TaxID=455 RepID=A0A0W0UTR6_9GAMM|nr:diacylglycerol kinase family protein [Legionella jamestowniensis]KTD11272.1 Diacylglycerol kinase [Legionella jamestowniensis]OCH98127.1 diacylglycerol kinase [Legionella jamestowniensis]SFL69700.1 Diacylglycerol kinase family enzyme [Legionella jamestowniensis DSM 19215]